jgi:hypothetical protein
MIKLTNVCL